MTPASRLVDPPATARSRAASRPGSSVVAMLLGLFLLEIAIAGLIFVCTQEAVISYALVERLRLRAAAESAVDAAVAAWPADSLRSLPPGARHRPAAAAGTLHGGARFAAEVERLHGAWFLVRGEGMAAAAPARAEAAALVSMFDTAPFWHDFAAAVSSGGPIRVGPGAVLDAAAAGALMPPWSAASCPADAALDMSAALGTVLRPALAVAQLPDAQIDPAAALAGSPPVALDSALAQPAFDTVGPLPLAQLAALAGRVETGGITLQATAAGGVCDEAAPGNWGAPFDPVHPCADHVPLVFAPGDLEVLGGEGQALLVVAGHLRLHAGVRLAGAVLALGGVTASGAEVLGGLRLGPAPSVLDGVVRYDTCALWRAFTRPAALRLATRRSEHWWLPVF